MRSLHLIQVDGQNENFTRGTGSDDFPFGKVAPKKGCRCELRLGSEGSAGSFELEVLQVTHQKQIENIAS